MDVMRGSLINESGTTNLYPATMTESEVHRVCGTEVWAQTGWVQSIGYPEYYLGQESDCAITIRVDEGQKVQLTITDLSVRGNYNIFVNLAVQQSNEIGKKAKRDRRGKE